MPAATLAKDSIFGGNTENNMLKIMDIGLDNAVAFTVSGKITQQEMHLVLEAAREKVVSHGSIVILERIESFEGIEVAAIVEEFKYLLDVGFSNISKVAIVTDKKWVKHIVRIEDKLFGNIDIKCFHNEEQPQAIEFLSS